MVDFLINAKNQTFFQYTNKSNTYLHVIYQGRSHAFESEGAQFPKAILGPFAGKSGKAHWLIFF